MDDRYADNADHYRHVGIEGTNLLAYRDLPRLIEKYVSGKTAIDFGCGSGTSTRLLRSLGFLVTGLDISPAQLQLARVADPTGDYRQIGKGDADLPIEGAALVLSAFVFLEMRSKQDMLAAARAVQSALADTGLFLMVVTTQEFYGGNWLSLDTTFEENLNPQSGSKVRVRFPDIGLTLTDYFWSDPDYTQVLNTAGFEVIERHYPLGLASDGFDWKDECVTAPFVIYVARKRAD